MIMLLSLLSEINGVENEVSLRCGFGFGFGIGGGGTVVVMRKIKSEEVQDFLKRGVAESGLFLPCHSNIKVLFCFFGPIRYCYPFRVRSILLFSPSIVLANQILFPPFGLAVRHNMTTSR